MFGDYLKAKKDQYEQRKAERHRWEDPWWESQGSSRSKFWENMYRSMSISIPLESFQALGLKETADLDAVKNAYRQLAKTHHPDKGGSSEGFREVTDAKNRCLAYLV